MKFYEFKEDEKRVDIFNERWYPIEINGTIKWLRNVTTILGVVDKGYNHDEWLKQTGYNSEIIIDRAGRFGTAFHQLAERYLLEETIKYHDCLFLGEQTSTALWERFMLWLDFWKELNEKHVVTYKPEGIEYICHSEKYNYAGTVDLCATVDGINTLFDWKTGKNIYKKDKRQQIAYMAATNTTQAKLIHIPAVKPNQKGYRITDVEFTDKQFKLFLSIKDVFEDEHKDKPKILTLPLEVNIKEK